VRLIAEGRASEILDLGGGRVLRRFKAGGNPEREARVMEHARRHPHPVPEVHEVRADALVLELVGGPTMAADGLAKPHTMEAHAKTLAALHERLHRIPGLEQGTLLHLDLHPENVLMSKRGPVVIDWTNARDGEPELDAALAWLILMTSGGAAGQQFARLFARHVDVLSGLDEAAHYRLADRNVTDAERAEVQRLVASQYD
jgi:aminoglycoside phosphotransferase (APT) family kinase protein